MITVYVNPQIVFQLFLHGRDDKFIPNFVQKTRREEISQKM